MNLGEVVKQAREHGAKTFQHLGSALRCYNQLREDQNAEASIQFDELQSEHLLMAEALEEAARIINGYHDATCLECEEGAYGSNEPGIPCGVARWLAKWNGTASRESKASGQKKESGE